MKAWPWFCIAIMLSGADGDRQYAHHSSTALSAAERELIAKVDGSKPSFVVLGKTARTLTGLIYRARTGEAEFHEAMADIFVVRTGAASLALGGKLHEPRQTGPGEFAAESIDEGERRAITAGDVIYIPAGLPHQVIVGAGQAVTYVILKVKEP